MVSPRVSGKRPGTSHRAEGSALSSVALDTVIAVPVSASPPLPLPSSIHVRLGSPSAVIFRRRRCRFDAREVAILKFGVRAG